MSETGKYNAAQYADLDCCVGCFVSSIGGVLLVNHAVRRSGKASVLVMILAGIIGLGAVLTGVFGGQKAIHALEKGEIGFHSFCAT